MIKSKEKLIALLMPVAALLAAMLVGAILIISVGENPVRVFSIMIKGAVGDWRSFTDTLVKAIPLVFTGLAFAFAAKCSVWNIGAEGQLYMGAVASIFFGAYLKGLPMVIHLPLTLLAGALAGGIWAGIVAWLKVRLKINEVVNTIMMNYIATLIVSALVYGPMIEHQGKSPQTREILASAQFPVLFEGTKLHAGLLVAIAACVLFWVIFKHTSFGYKITAVGLNAEAARVNGISVKKYIFFSMFISGIFGGLAGAVEMMGTTDRLIIGFSPAYGSDGIAVALLGQLNAVGIFLSSFLFGALRMGATAMQRQTEVPMQLISIIQGLAVLFVIAGAALSGIIVNRMKKRRVQ